MTTKTPNPKSSRFAVEVANTRHLSIDIEATTRMCEDAFFFNAPNKTHHQKKKKKKKNNNNNNNNDDALFNAEKKKFSDVMSLLRGIVHHEHAAKRDALRRGFDASAGLVPKKKRTILGETTKVTFTSEEETTSMMKGPTEHEALSVWTSVRSARSRTAQAPRVRPKAGRREGRGRDTGAAAVGRRGWRPFCWRHYAVMAAIWKKEKSKSCLQVLETVPRRTLSGRRVAQVLHRARRAG